MASLRDTRTDPNLFGHPLGAEWFDVALARGPLSPPLPRPTVKGMPSAPAAALARSTMDDER